MTHPLKYKPTWQSLDSRPMPPWFEEAKFGIFIHWGIYSVPAWRPVGEQRYASYAEWYYASVIGDLERGGDAFHRTNYGDDFEYRDFAPMFGAELFDPETWADLFARSGARYVVLTAKHHDGYCLWPTKSPYKEYWNSGEIGPRRDLVGELTEAVRDRGLRMGLYYSIVEWETNPTHRTKSGYFLDQGLIERYQIPKHAYVEKHLLPQLKELVMNYQPSLLFADGGEWDGDEAYLKTKEFLAWLYNKAPNREEVVVNDRWAKGMPGAHGDYYSSEYADADMEGSEHPWEESRGIGGSYGFNRAENLDDYSSSEALVHELVDVVSRGGNFLLNVGPTADGRIPVIMQERLADIGEWLRVNGEAIYDTTAWRGAPTGSGDEAQAIYYTAKGNDIYAICTAWPQNELHVVGLDTGGAISVELLGYKQAIEWISEGDRIMITPPLISPAQVPCRYAYVFKLSNAIRLAND
ncbi:MAG: alpha-L-fucosidase [Chloroflexi bacterium]|nr:alpha-L-fucosidase [Chloroflexota bacterium]